jgi:predicted secreted hydrolase
MTPGECGIAKRRARRARWHSGAAALVALAICADLSADTAWRSAVAGRPVVLPDDHRSHPDYRLEWWYYTGNLFSPEGRRFGYQLTFFRVGINRAPPTPSRWAVRDLHMAHLAITDVAASRHAAAERLNRAGAGWAGARDDTYHVWNDDWSATLEDGRHRLLASSRAPEIAVDLTLDEGRAPALHGIAGFSQKGSLPGNASYYYSLTRMPTRGTVRIGDETFAVTGASWMDHEFGTTFLERDRKGWDWFSIQLDDGRDLMVFQLRGRDGSIDPRMSGTLVSPERGARSLDPASITLEPVRWWKSPATGGRYPVEWRLAIPAEALELRVTAVVDAQEMNGLPSGLTYWEGMIDVADAKRSRAVAGRGYLEMTGYSGPPMGEMMATPE